MEGYTSEEEQVEALKKWWKENGTSVVIGLIVGLGGVTGWRSWQGYQENQGIAASSQYQQVLDILGTNDIDQSKLVAGKVVGEHSKSGYAPLSSLILAKIAAEEGDLSEARRHLKWVIDHAELEEIRQIATLRMAKVMFQGGEVDGALELLTDSDAGTFGSAYKELQGDILLAKKDLTGAQAAYQDAIEKRDKKEDTSLLQMKIDDLAASTGGSVGS